MYLINYFWYLTLKTILRGGRKNPGQVVNGYFLLLTLRVWKYLLEVACCRFFIVGYDEMCIFQVGFAAGDGEAEHVEASKLMQGLLYQGILKFQARE